MLSKKTLWIATLMVVATPTLAMAHPGHGENGVTSGLLHPLTGLDHLLVIAAIALLAVLAGGRALWAVPTAFMACGVAGGVAASQSATIAGTAMPWVEVMIVASVLVCGILLLRPTSVSQMTLSLVPLFGLFHGYAHVYEWAGASGSVGYCAGALMATAALLGIAVGSGVLLRSLRSQRALFSVTQAAGGSLIVAAALTLLTV